MTNKKLDTSFSETLDKWRGCGIISQPDNIRIKTAKAIFDYFAASKTPKTLKQAALELGLDPRTLARHVEKYEAANIIIKSDEQLRGTDHEYMDGFVLNPSLRPKKAIGRPRGEAINRKQEIFNCLLAKPRTKKDIMSVLDMRYSSTTRYLKQLEESGLIYIKGRSISEGKSPSKIYAVADNHKEILRNPRAFANPQEAVAA